MRIVYFTHSLTSCWNHGNAHFLRGVLRDLARRGHAVTAFEPEDAWSLANLLADHGRRASRLPQCLSDLTGTATPHRPGGRGLPRRRPGHRPRMERSGAGRRAGPRAATVGQVPAAVPRHPPPRGQRSGRHPRLRPLGYDGVLAFGETLAEVYRVAGAGAIGCSSGTRRPTRAVPSADESASAEAWSGSATGATASAPPRSRPSCCGRPNRPAELDVHGVRYPPEAKAMLARHGARYRAGCQRQGAEVFARHLATVHVPRRFYVETLPGIPTIRVFEALACGIPLVSAPWRDAKACSGPARTIWSPPTATP
jgi:hypothetical protein